MTTTASDSAFGNRQKVAEPVGEGHAPERTGARGVKSERTTADSANAKRDWRALLHAPEIWAEDRPATRRIWWYSAHGPQAPKRGFWRGCCVAYGLLVAIPANTLVYLAAEPLARLSGVGGTLDVARQNRPRIQILWAAIQAARDEGAPTWRLAISYGSAAAVAVLYQAGWLFARPTRLLAAGANYFVIAHTLGLSWPF